MKWQTYTYIKGSLLLIFSLLFFAIPSLAAEKRQFNELIQLYDELPLHFNSAIRVSPETIIPASNIFVFLFRSGEGSQLRPYLIEKWEISDDQKRYDFQIKSGTRFHDGQEVTADDVVFSIQTMMAHHPYGAELFKSLASVEVVGQNQLTIQLKSPDQFFLRSLTCPNTPILPRHVYETENFRANPANKQAVGSGPFKVAWYMPGRGYILKRFENFMDPEKPYLDRYIGLKRDMAMNSIVEIASDNAQLMAFVSDPDLIREAKDNSNLRITGTGYDSYGAIDVIEFNIRKRYLKNRSVREAITLAIDRSHIAREIYQSTSLESGSVFHSGGFIYFESDHNKLYNPGAAKHIIERVKSTMPTYDNRIQLRLTWPPDRTGKMESVANYIQKQLALIDVEIVLEPPISLVEWIIEISKWEHDITLKQLVSWGDPTIGVKKALFSKDIDHMVLANTSGFVDHHVDDLFIQLRAQPLALVDRAQIISDIVDIIADEIPVLGLMEANYYTVYSSEIQNIPTGPWGIVGPLDEVFWPGYGPKKKIKEAAEETVGAYSEEADQAVNPTAEHGVTVENSGKINKAGADKLDLASDIETVFEGSGLNFPGEMAESPLEQGKESETTSDLGQ